MPGKSGKGRSRHHPRSKRKKEKRQLLATAAPQQTVAPRYQPEVAQKVRTAARSEPAVAAKTVAPRDKLALPKYPHLSAELKRIGILAGIIVIILIVLAVALP